MKRKFAAVWLFFLIALLLPAVLAAIDQTGLSAVGDLPFRRIVDDASIRGRVADSWLFAPLREIVDKKAERFLLPDSRYMEARSEKSEAERLVLLTRSASETFTIGSQGSWIVHRAANGGAIIRIRFFPRSDPHLYLQFRPGLDGRSLLDIVLYGAYLAFGAQLPWNFTAILTAPLSQVLELRPLEPLAKYIDIDAAAYADTRRLLALIRARLPELNYTDDGALDENGRPVYIETGLPQTGKVGLNCSGFVKWLVDGLLRPYSGTYLSPAALKIPPIPRGNGFSEPYEEAYDPYFGLDWTRNLAKAADLTLRGAGDDAGWEVRDNPFAALRLSSGNGAAARPFVGYLPDVGYEIAGLKPLLYALAAREPNWFYLASVSRDRIAEPAILRHFHVAALFPFFGENGQFQVACLESAAETSLDAFISRYPGHYVHLVRVPVETRFQP